MTITYTLTPIPGYVEAVVEDDDRVFMIPESPDNADWRNYQDWLASGNKPNPAPPQAQSQSLPSYEELVNDIQMLKDKIAAMESDGK